MDLKDLPDLGAGVPMASLEEGEPFRGRFGDESVVLVRIAGEVYAVGGACMHYGAPLADGMVVVGNEIRCPWHHACFSLRTGEVLAHPALTPLATWDVQVVDGVVHLGSRRRQAVRPAAADVRAPWSSLEDVVIVGGGAAGSAAADTLRARGYAGRITIIDPDPDAPYDRPNLSKDYLAGTAEEAWLPLRPSSYDAEHAIRRIRERATAIHVDHRRVETESGIRIDYDALLLATGAEPLRPRIPGIDLPHVHVLRSLSDCRALIDAVHPDANVIVAGASFIGMEAAASLRRRGARVTVVAPEEVPFAKTLGPQLGTFLKQLHELNDVTFRLGHTVGEITARSVMLEDGTTLDADVVLLGIGVRPKLDIAESAGVRVDNGVVVDAFLQSSVPGIYAAGDIARYPDARTGELQRIEHWVHAERQGAVAARNILGGNVRFTSVPFFWTAQFDTTISYVGHATRWSDIITDGSPESGDFSASYRSGDDVVAHVTIGRDRESLTIEHQMELESR